MNPPTQQECKFGRYRRDLLSSVYQNLTTWFYKFNEKYHEKYQYDGVENYPHLKQSHETEQFGSSIENGMTLRGQVKTKYLEWAKHHSDVPDRLEIVVASDENWNPIVSINSIASDHISIQVSGDLNKDVQLINEKIDDILSKVLENL